MSFSTVSLTAYHYVLPISPYTGVISIPRRKDPRRRRKARVLPRAAIVEARPQALPAIKEVTGGNNAVPFRRRDSSFRDRTGDMQAEARAMTRAANASVYSPELLLVKYGSRPVRVLRRTLEIFIGLGSFGFKLWLDQLNGQLNQNKRLRAIQLRNIFTRLGPTFVKIGQGLSTRPDLCPPEYLEELSELQVIWMRK